jgi:transcriptional antiterminator RfaH
MSEVPGNGSRHAGETARRSFAGPLPPHAPAVPDEFAWNLPWYVAYAKARQEHVAKENLLRQGYSVYLPQMKVLRRIRGHHQARLEPLFPRYLFVQPGSLDHSIAPVRSTSGVSAIVRFGQESAVMRPETLRNIREFEARQNAAKDEDISPFQCDERVHVVDGPLAGLEGLITEVSRDRVVVLMQLLGHDTRVNMSHHQLLVAH